MELNTTPKPTDVANESFTKSPLQHNPSLVRALGLWYSLVVILGHAIGSGIFVKPGAIALEGGSTHVVFSAWTIGAILCLLGAFCFAELSSLLPFSGGIYVYLREAYGPLPAFLFGWQSAFFSRPASSAALSTIAVGSLCYCFGIEAPKIAIAAAAVFVIIVFTLFNIAGVLWGARIQLLTATMKCAMLALVILSPLIIATFEPSRSISVLPRVSYPAEAPHWLYRLLATLVPVMWAFSGWEAIVPVSEEVKDPRRNLPRALVLGAILLSLLYFLAALAYHLVLPLEVMIHPENRSHLAEIVMYEAYGQSGKQFLSIGIALASFGTVNSNLLTSPRVAFAMSRDNVLPGRMARVHPRFRTPSVSIVVHAAMSVLLIIVAFLLVECVSYFQSRTPFDLLTDCIVFQSGVFYTAGVASLFVIRSKRGMEGDCFRSPMFPWIPAIYVGAYVMFVLGMFWSRPYESLGGCFILIAGLIAFPFLRKDSAPSK